MKINSGVIAFLILFFSFSSLFSQTKYDDRSKGDLITEQAKFGLSSLSTDNLRVTSSHLSATSGIYHIYLNQAYNGLDIVGTASSVHYLDGGDLFKTTSNLLPLNTKGSVSTLTSIDVDGAFQSIGQHFGLTYAGIDETISVASRPGDVSRYAASSISAEDITTRAVYVVGDNNTLELAYDIVIVEPTNQFYWDVRVSAETGEVLNKVAWTLECNFGHDSEDCGHVHTSACKVAEPQVKKENHNQENSAFNPDSYRVFPIPFFNPDEAGYTPSVIVNPADLTASPFGWHDTNGAAGAEYTITRGNNVYAQDDMNGNNGTGSAPNGGANLDFLDTYNHNNEPTGTQNNIDASITNLFYWNNVMHDVWYQYGFDEVSGNFQQNNYGNGGAGGDYVIADALDGSGTNNANFSTPTDGSNGKMQMFEWTNGPYGATSFTNSVGSYGYALASFNPTGGVSTGTVSIVDVNDGVGTTLDGCESPFSNAGAIAGNIALIDRGNCNFTQKVENAQTNGAVGVIVCNNVAGAPIVMGGTPSGSPVITIPSLMISQGDCATLRAGMPATGDITISGNTTSQRTGDLDNGIIAHEYGHGISIRLAGGASNSNCLSNTEQAGEGWSDWFGLMMTIKPSDNGTESRGVGTYVNNQTPSGAGIRTYPYSTDFSINPHTYDDINGEAAPHGVGSVFCAMLWEMTWELIGVYGFDPDLYNGTGGNNIAMALVIEGLKLQPCSPGFVDMRDAILAADVALYAGANECYIWDAFARRGLGASANQGSSASKTDGTEAFDLPTTTTTLNFTKTSNVATVAAGGNITYTLSVLNPTSACASTQSNVVICDPLPANTTFVSASNAGSLSGGSVVYPGVTLAPGQTHTVTFVVSVNASIGGPTSFSDDVEGGNAGWSATATDAAAGIWSISNASANSPSNSWFAPDVASPDNQYLTSNEFIPLAGCEMNFWHSYDTEVDWDGGRVEYSADGGSTWIDLGSLMTQNGYNGILDNNAATPGFSGTSSGFIETKINLNSLATQCIQVRFFMHCDPAVGGVGWYVDDIDFTAIETTIPNTATVKVNGVTAGSASVKPTTVTMNTTGCPGCYTNLTHGTACDLQVLETAIADYESSTWITTALSTVIKAGAKVDYDASTYIEINPNLGHTFEVELGAQWEAFIDGCNGGAGGINLQDDEGDSKANKNAKTDQQSPENNKKQN